MGICREDLKPADHEAVANTIQISKNVPEYICSFGE